MKNIKICDTTLNFKENAFSFKEKMEIARKLEMLGVNVIELPEIEDERTEILLIKTIASFVKKGTISVGASNKVGIENAKKALENAANKKLRIELPASTVGMEYTCHKKPDKMLGFIKEIFSFAKESFADIEFAVIDATRADESFLENAINVAVENGATSVTLYDNFAEMMPDEFAEFANKYAKKVNVPLGVFCEDKNGLSIAKSIMAVKSGADFVKTSALGSAPSLFTFAEMVKNSGNRNGYTSDIKYTQLGRIINQINWVIDTKKSSFKNDESKGEENVISLDAKDDETAVKKAVMLLGYDLTDEDNMKVYEEFKRTAEKKNVGAKELEAIIASVALQVPSTYKLENFVINSGNIISSSAQITLIKNGKEISAVQMGDGPIDAAFKAIDTIIGTHYELDDFQIQAVTEGKGAMGSAIIKLRKDGKLYSGQGISTDILGAGIRAYISAVNKIVYEEA